MTQIDRVIEETARRNGLGEDCVRVLFQALVAGGGLQAQFSHPELGGMGQWSGGMLQIGEMFNHGLRSRVAAACADLAELARRPGTLAAGPGPDPSPRDDGDASGVAGFGAVAWWPGELGRPVSTGTQDGARYACFPDRRRLAVERGGDVTLYDTGDHRISGFSQQQGTGSTMAFTSQFGAVMLEALRVIAKAPPGDGQGVERLIVNEGAMLIGGCFCGRVRYAAAGTPFHETLCHCSDCRRSAGAPAVAWFSVARRDFSVTAGQPKGFRSSPTAIRRFCADCGTQLTFEADGLPDEIDVTTATLDDPDRLPPKDHSHAGSRVIWDHLSDAIPVRAMLG